MPFNYNPVTSAGKKIKKFIDEKAGSVRSEVNKSPMAVSLVTSGKNEAFAQALALIFGGKPKYYDMQDGKTHFIWEGDELLKARERVAQLAKSDPNNKTAVHYGDVVAPLIGKALIVPASILAVYIMAKKK